jgi:hypothetical protein
MSLDKSSLLDFLGVLDNEVSRKITIVAVGGTAMTLLNLKPSTIDVDFTIPSEDADEFENALRKVPHGLKIDYWTDGMVFSQMLPDDYIEKSIQVKTRLKSISLRALHPLDIVVTKIGRLNEKDIQDIGTCIKSFKLKKSQIESRAKLVEYVGHEESYQINLRYAIKKLFTSPKG